MMGSRRASLPNAMSLSRANRKRRVPPDLWGCTAQAFKPVTRDTLDPLQTDTRPN